MNLNTIYQSSRLLMIYTFLLILKKMCIRDRLCFISLLLLGIHPWLAGIGAFAYTFTSGHFVIAATGHYTKLDSLVYLPMILSGFHLIFYHQRIIGSILFTTGLLFNIQANHIQMTYYIFIVPVSYTHLDVYKRQTHYSRIYIA